MEEKEISQAVIGRLPRYFRYLGQLRDEGTERVSSQELSDIMKVTASQIRQDLNHFGGFGQQGYGYNVGYLYEEIGKILGLDKEHKLIIIGAGHLGQALANYVNFERRGFIFCGIFDNNPAIYGMKIRDIEVRPIEEMEAFIRNNDIDIAVLTIPKQSAAAAAELQAIGMELKPGEEPPMTGANINDVDIEKSLELRKTVRQFAQNNPEIAA
ncbi:MAG: redox-sensing transcriptional repressor Rex, partial [Lachnospiraceae bacterium]|nr:redox-sensing transcriptional repressor Rex [Lachnospiraceae bacterium]